MLSPPFMSADVIYGQKEFFSLSFRYMDAQTPGSIAHEILSVGREDIQEYACLQADAAVLDPVRL